MILIFEKIKLLRAKDIKDILGVSLHTAYEIMHDESLPSMKIGGRYYVEYNKFIEWFNDEENNPFYNN